MIVCSGLKLRRDVTLVGLKTEHAANMYKWICDPLVRDNIGLRTEPSLEKTELWITSATENAAVVPLAILLEGDHVGNVVLDRIDHHVSSARLSVYIGESTARGSGVGLTSIYKALSKAFSDLSLHKVWLIVHSNNYQAINCYIKLGFMLEGILRDEFILDGRRLSAFHMGILAEEFKRLHDRAVC